MSSTARRNRLPITIPACVLLLSSVICACGGSSSITSKTPSSPTPPGPTPTPTPTTMPTSQHVVLVMEENQSYTTVAGNMTAWPHLNALIKAGALASNYYADAHPSIPNYFMLTTGQPLTEEASST